MFPGLQLTESITKAAEKGDVPELKRLLEQEDVEIQTRALIAAVKNDHIECLRLLLEHKDHINEAWHRISLAKAALNSRVECLHLLLQHNASVEAEDGGYMLLTQAIEADKPEVILPILLEAKAQIEVKDKEGWTPVVWAAKIGLTESLRFLLEHKAATETKDERGRTLLTHAVQENRIESLKLLLKHKANVDTADHLDNTPLRSAAIGGYTEAVRLLLQASANIEAKDNGGVTSLAWAARNGHTECLSQLLEHKAQVEAKDERGRTSLSWVVTKDHKEGLKCLDLLLEHKAEVNSKDNADWTPLAHAAHAGQTQYLKRLLQGKAQIESKDNEDAVPLTRAVLSGSTEAVRLLLQANANIEAKDNDNMTPLAYATTFESISIIGLLLAHGASAEEVTIINPEVAPFFSYTQALRLLKTDPTFPCLQRDWLQLNRDEKSAEFLTAVTTYSHQLEALYLNNPVAEELFAPAISKRLPLVKAEAKKVILKFVNYSLVFPEELFKIIFDYLDGSFYLPFYLQHLGKMNLARIEALKAAQLLEAAPQSDPKTATPEHKADQKSVSVAEDKALAQHLKLLYQQDQADAPQPRAESKTQPTPPIERWTTPLSLVETAAQLSGIRTTPPPQEPQQAPISPAVAPSASSGI